jgi:hypothetical protein
VKASARFSDPVIERVAAVAVLGSLGRAIRERARVFGECFSLAADPLAGVADPAGWSPVGRPGDEWWPSEWGCCAVSGRVKSDAAYGVGCEGTRHPGTGAARARRVSGREPVETRAAKEKIPQLLQILYSKSISSNFSQSYHKVITA